MQQKPFSNFLVHETDDAQVKKVNYRSIMYVPTMMAKGILQ